jgi:4a-hydroxytetrahydrobiopterin dehydratase
MGRMSELLHQAAIDSALAELDGWSGGPDGITRTVELSSFPAAIAVVDRVAEAAEAADHHPDIDIRWRTLTFTLATHSAGGVTGKDIDMAGRIDDIVRAAG